ncbi:MAG: hypothetical protein ABSG38_10870 [Spirochaetia bacterium]|jgi:hypothetical protein
MPSLDDDDSASTGFMLRILLGVGYFRLPLFKRLYNFILEKDL